MEQADLRATLDAIYADWRRFFVTHHPVAAALQGDGGALGHLDPGFADAEWHGRVERPALEALQARLDACAGEAWNTPDETLRTLHAVLSSRVAAGRNDAALTLRSARPDLALDWASEALFLVLGAAGLRAAGRRARLEGWLDAVRHLCHALSTRFESRPLPAVFRRLGLDALTDLEHLFREHAAPWLGGFPGPLRRALGGLRNTLRHAATTPEGFRCGEGPLGVFLRDVEGLEITPAALLAEGETMLAAERDALTEAAARLRPGVSPRRVLAGLADEHGAPEHLLRDTRICVDELRAWVRACDLMTLPDAPVCRVATAPAYLRALSAACLDVPGPWQRRRTRACFFLAAPLPGDSPSAREATVREFNRTRLAWVAAHETYPGHLVEHLHRRRAPHEAFEVADSEVYIEGWAHYAEGLLVSHGFRDGAPAIAFGVAWARVLRAVRLVVALELHAGELTVAAAEARFRGLVLLSPAEARREASRAVFDPTVFTYALGRRLIESRRAAAARHPGFSLRRFHDDLLGQGTIGLGLRA